MNNARTIHGSLEAACRAVGVEPHEHCGGSGFIAANVLGARRGRGSGRIRFFPDNSGGYVKNWTDGREALFFYGYKDGERIPPEEWRRRMEVLKRMKQEDEENRARLQATVAQMAGQIIEAAHSGALHPYLTRKRVALVPGAPLLEVDGITAQKIVNAYPPAEDGYRQKLEGMGARALIVPMTLDTPAPVSFQLITTGGKKTFLKGGRVKGTVWRPGDIPFASDTLEKIGLCEGVATALSIRRMYDIPCVAGISAGNLIDAVRTLRTCYPRAEIHIFADRDANKAGEEGARAAARAVARTRLFLCPEFSAAERAKFKAITGGDKPSDFNDLMIIKEAS